MKKPTHPVSQIAAGLSLIALIFGGLILYARRAAPPMAQAAAPVAERFYQLCKARDYKSAHQLFAPAMAEGVSVEDLAKKWAKFEAHRGALQSWQPARDGLGGGNLVNVFPPSVDFTHLAKGANGQSGLVLMRLIPVENQWRMDKLVVEP